MSERTQQLGVRVIEGRDLIPCDKSGLSDPYCLVSVGSFQKKTRVVKENLSPKWEDEEFTFELKQYAPAELLIEVYDWNRFASHKRMGRAKLPVKDLVLGKQIDTWVPLTPFKESDKVSGEIHVSFGLVNPSAPVRKRPESQSESLYPLKRTVGESPLFAAIKNSDLYQVIRLVEDPKLNINAPDDYGYTPLHAACCLFSENDDEILLTVLQHKDINVNVENSDKNTPLHYFCAKFRSPNCSDAFEIFVAKGANINAVNLNGETPLHKAIFNNSVRILMVNLLIKNDADVNRKNSKNETPLHYAVRLGREDLVSILLKAGAHIDAKGSENKTPYDLAVEEKYEKMASLLQRAKDIYDWLDELGLERYKQVFIREEVFKEILPDVDEKTLDKLGIQTAGHRLKILKAVKTIREELQMKTNQTAAVEVVISEPTPINIEKELRELKHINKSGTWILHHNELEFTVKLGTGTSGTVYKGLYQQKEVAIKVLKAEQSQTELEEFKKEFHIMSSIQSPYLVFFFGACLEPKLCMVMELCSRGSLYHVMNDITLDIGWDKIFSFAREMIMGVDCLHSNEPQVVHRDFKSLNLMVNEQLHVKVGDFGLSRFNTDTQKETLAKMRGTFAYCAPEVYFGEPFSTKSDVFSIAVVLWELVVRVIKKEYIRPYSEHKNLQFDFQIIIQTAKKGLRLTIPPTCPEGFANLIKSSWSHETDSRPSCKQIIETLDNLQKDYEANKEAWDNCIETK